MVSWSTLALELAGKTLAPGRHYLDSGYLSAALLVSEAARHGIVRFAAATCRACAARDKCTTATRTGRQLFLRPREIHQAAAARAVEGGISFQADYARRAGIEGTMHQATSTAPGAPATAACRKPASTTHTWPVRSTSSTCTHSGPARH